MGSRPSEELGARTQKISPRGQAEERREISTPQAGAALRGPIACGGVGSTTSQALGANQEMSPERTPSEFLRPGGMRARLTGAGECEPKRTIASPLSVGQVYSEADAAATARGP